MLGKCLFGKSPRIRWMCGRFACGLNGDELCSAIHDMLPRAVNQDVENRGFHPSYNIAPNTWFPMIRRKSDSSALVMQTMKWGISSEALVPGLQRRSFINARDDTVCKQKSIWKDLMQHCRCIIFCQGFYEWKNHDLQAKRTAHFVGMLETGKGRRSADGKSRKLMPMAGFWTQTIDGEYLFTVVTTQSNKQLDFLHDRMPCILPDVKAMLIWLGVSNENDASKLLKPYPYPLDCYAVPPEVGTVGTSNENYIYPLCLRKDGVKAMFENAKLQTDKPKPTAKEEVASAKDELRSISSIPEKRTAYHAASPIKRTKARETSRANGTPSLEMYWTNREK